MQSKRNIHAQSRLRIKAAVAIAGIVAAVSIFEGNVFAGDPAFVISKLSVADKLLDVRAEDLNADGRKDILILHRKGLQPDETRWISVFWQGDDGLFSTAADQSWEIDTTAVMLDIGDIAGDGQLEICFVTSDDVRCYPIENGRYSETAVTLFEARGMTVFPSIDRIPLINFVRDWNEDGTDDIGLFRFEGLSIYSRDSSGVFSMENGLEMELRTGMYRGALDFEEDLTAGLVARFSFPDIHLIDYDGDGGKDLITTVDDRVVVYRKEPDGGFTEKPYKDVLFDVRTKHEKIESLAELHTTVTDLDADGYAEAIVTKQTAKGLSNFRGVIHIFNGGPDGYAGEPDQVIVSEGTASVRTFIRDVNGDGRMDLILPSIKISITSIIRFLLSRSIPVNFNIFLLNDDNRFSERPDFKKEVKFKIDFSGESDTQAMDLDGDYNGDKIKDFVFATDQDELSIYLGIEDGGDRLFSKKPVTRVTADSYGELSSPDLNGDGYSDMIIHYPQSKERKGIVEVLINQGRLR